MSKILGLVVKRVADRFRHFRQNIHTEYNVGKKNLKRNPRNVNNAYIPLKEIRPFPLGDSLSKDSTLDIVFISVLKVYNNFWIT